LHVFLAPGGIFESSSQYLLAECEYKAAGVPWVILVFVTIPVAFPETQRFLPSALF
jgi:hypothetical protein